ncbi:MAG TPA: hypothetical protein VL362_02305 [Patescibacteria group bacterium]|jgi:hypothetical protein|nr:hypothetical protein [Patescibacteria group bacterium]
MVLLAISLMILGVAVGLLGYQLFRIVLPIAGLAAGTIVGYTSVRELFGTGAVSTTATVVVAVVIALLLALLSYAFFDMAITIFSAFVFMAILVYLGIALGLGENGFAMTMLALFGLIVGALIAVSTEKLSVGLVALVTSLLGMGFLLAGIYIFSQSISTSMLYSDGVITSVAQHLDNALLWLFVWMSGAIMFRYFQVATVRYELFSDQLRYKNQ